MNGIKILIVEDELLIAQNIAKKLEKMGHEITEIVSSGAAAVRSISEQRPELILMDIAIKGSLDGIKTAEKIKPADIPIVFLTAYADDLTLEKAANTGCYGYLVKPFQEHELNATIKIVVSKYQEQSSIIRSLQQTVNDYSSQYNDIYINNISNLPNQLFLRDLFSYLLSSFKSTEDLDTSIVLDDINQQEPAQTAIENLIAILYLNFNRLEKISDSLENNAKNQLIKSIAERLNSCVQNFACQGSTLHLPHNEFAVMIGTTKSRSIINDYAKQIIKLLNQPFLIDNREIFLSVSIGIAFYPFDSDDVEELLQQAKQAMLYAKKQGITGYRWFTAALYIGTSQASEEVKLETELHHALVRNELELYYQPKVNIATGKIVGAEALLRWNHPSMGLIGPNKFIPLAEENGLIIPISEWILNTACKQTKIWQDSILKDFKIAINLSGRQFRQAQLFHKITQVLFSSSIDPKYLELEVTEKILVENIKANVQRLNFIKKLGIKIALDDFGTGYSSLGYLQQFPFDILKIDRCFIRNVDQNITNSIIAKNIIQMAHQLGLQVVAEGVETKGEYNFLQDNNCDEMQGFLISRPLSVREFDSLMINRQNSAYLNSATNY